MNIPKLPAETTPFLWGMAAGAVALAIVGFNWGGWVTGGTAEQMAGARADAAIVASLAPICVTQFQKGPEALGRLAKLKEINSWEQGDYVSKGGWATMPGGNGEPIREVAMACAETLVKIGS
jgi:hypothetical protein